MKIAIALLLTLLYSAAQSNIYDDPCNDMLFSGKTCEIKFSGHTVTAHSDGRVLLGSEENQLNLPKGFGLDWLRDVVVDGDAIFIIFDISNADYGSSLIFSISLVNQKLNWQATVKGFNGSPLLAYENAIYAGAIGTIAKFDARTGKLSWEHTGLYERDTQAFNSFIKPYIEGDKVVFTEHKVSSASYAGNRKIVVIRSTGEIVSK